MGVGFVKEVLFNSGEGLSETDLNNVQRFMLFMLGDGAFGCSAPHLALTDQPGMSTSHLYAFGNSGAPYEDASGTRTPNFLRGLIAQRIAGTAPDGTDSQVLFYFLDADEPQVARAAVVTDPRWDVVSVNLARANADSQTRDFEDASTRALTSSSFNKQRRTVCTITWTTGTESATPVEPAIPAGDVKLAAFQIRPSVTSFDPTQDIRDYRMPIGPTQSIMSHWSYSREKDGDADWQELATGEIATGGGATSSETVFSHCPIAEVKRLIAVGLHSANGIGTSTVALTRRTPASTDSVILDISSVFPSSSNYSEYNILGLLGAPLWANGYAAGYAAERVATNRTHVNLRFVADGVTTGMSLGMTRWRVAG